jgi:non-heme chloroperoxidase
LTQSGHLAGSTERVKGSCDDVRRYPKLLKNGTLKTYKGFPNGMPTTNADTINADLLAFIKS